MSAATATISERLQHSDQARGPRRPFAEHATALPTMGARGCHTIVVAGGKGGVGRSVIALNLALSLAGHGGCVGLIDASPGVGSAEFLCGLNGYWNLSHVVQGCREFEDVVQIGPDGLKVVTGASCLAEEMSDERPAETGLFERLAQFELSLDWIVVDASGASTSIIWPFVEVADDLLLVTTPEATAITDAYAALKSYSRHNGPRLGMLVNQANSADVAARILDRLQQAAHDFLQVDLHRRGYVPRDAVVPMSVNLRRPFVATSPESPAALALKELAGRWTRPGRRDDEASYFARLGRFKQSGPSSVREMT